MVYESISASDYHHRFSRNAVERYQYEFWEPIIRASLRDHCLGDCLDLGCGTGTHILERASDSRVLIGVDVSANMLQYARAQGCPILVNGSAEDLPFLSNRFDCVYSIGLMEYVNASRMLKETHRVLKSGSKFLLMTPNKYGGRKWVSSWIWKMKKRAVHTTYYSRKEIIGLLEMNGFKVDKMVMKDGLIFLPKWTPEWLAMCSFKLVGLFFRWLPYNPWSQNMFFVATKF